MVDNVTLLHLMYSLDTVLYVVTLGYLPLKMQFL